MRLDKIFEDKVYGIILLASLGLSALSVLLMPIMLWGPIILLVWLITWFLLANVEDLPIIGKRVRDGNSETSKEK
ncbi:hypothetical protein [Acidithiobacillus sp.]|jgi:hypothetical protein|uniref:hypothetical protein n=1 Tax=Acidithiobacillus sp. TaxID=1872118 RepID=UPI0031FEF558